MILTLDQLSTIMPKAGKKAALYIGPLNVSMTACQINNSRRMGMYLAECGHESEDLTYMAEIWGPAQVPVQAGYWQRTDLGNTKPEAIALANAKGFFGVNVGKYFRGYGLIQVTGYNNQIQVAKYFGIAPENMVDWLQTIEGACSASAHFWKVNGLNEIADKENYDDLPNEFDEVSDRVNFGHPTKKIGDTMGWQDRLDHYKRASEVLMWADVQQGFDTTATRLA